MHADLAALQVLLEGVPLPAEKEDLLRYARVQESSGDGAALLERLPDREYRSLDEVAEALVPVQPASPDAARDVPRAESDLPPGGDDYVKPNPASGAVRNDAPPDNPPQKTIEQQTKTQNAQKERQEKLLGS